MTPERIVPWIVGVCTGLLGSQRKPLSQLVFGAMRCRWVSQADIGRSMAGQALVKHRIKQVARFVSNPEVEIAAGARGMMAIVAKAAGWQLPVALDWVDVRACKMFGRPFRFAVAACPCCSRRTSSGICSTARCVRGGLPDAAQDAGA
jgi:hypothetical protein